MVKQDSIKTSQQMITDLGPMSESYDKAREQLIQGYTEFFSHGCDDLGQLGHACNKENPNRQKLTKVPKSLSFDVLIDQVTCGMQHTLILSQRGELFGTGSNEFGQLGLNDRQLDYAVAPMQVLNLQGMGLQIESIASGSHHNLLLTKDL